MLEDTVADQSTPKRRTKGWSDSNDDMHPPSGYRVVEVNTPSCESLRDAISIRRDLELAQSYMSAFASCMHERTKRPRSTEDATMVAALVMYGRVFAKGIRKSRLPIESLNVDQRSHHEYFIALRNKFISHAVNSFEQTTAIAYLTDSSFASRRVTRVGSSHFEVVTIDAEEANAFQALCALQIRDVDRRIDALHGAIGKELQQLGMEAVYALPRLDRPRNVNRSDVLKRRTP